MQIRIDWSQSIIEKGQLNPLGFWRVGNRLISDLLSPSSLRCRFFYFCSRVRFWRCFTATIRSTMRPRLGHGFADVTGRRQERTSSLFLCLVLLRRANRRTRRDLEKNIENVLWPRRQWFTHANYYRAEFARNDPGNCVRMGVPIWRRMGVKFISPE